MPYISPYPHKQPMKHNQKIFLIEAGTYREEITIDPNLKKHHPLSHALSVLAALGGVASISALKKHGVRESHTQLLRSFRRSKKIRPLGGEYFALHTLTILPVETWIKRRLLIYNTPLQTESCVRLVLGQYPHGDPQAVMRWLCNRHDDIKVHRGFVMLA